MKHYARKSRAGGRQGSRSRHVTEVAVQPGPVGPMVVPSWEWRSFTHTNTRYKRRITAPMPVCRAWPTSGSRLNGAFTLMVPRRLRRRVGRHIYVRSVALVGTVSLTHQTATSASTESTGHLTKLTFPDACWKTSLTENIGCASRCARSRLCSVHKTPMADPFHLGTHEELASCRP